MSSNHYLTRQLPSLVVFILIFGGFIIYIFLPFYNSVDVPIYNDAQNVTKKSYQDGYLNVDITSFETTKSPEEVSRYYRQNLNWRRWRYRESAEDPTTLYFNRLSCPFYRLQIIIVSEQLKTFVEIKRISEPCR
jgi:hypothetical protein